MSESDQPRPMTPRQTGDPVLARAGADVLAQMAGTERLHPSLDADPATVDPAQLSVAAGGDSDHRLAPEVNARCR